MTTGGMSSFPTQGNIRTVREINKVLFVQLLFCVNVWSDNKYPPNLVTWSQYFHRKCDHLWNFLKISTQEMKYPQDILWNYMLWQLYRKNYSRDLSTEKKKNLIHSNTGRHIHLLRSSEHRVRIMYFRGILGHSPGEEGGWRRCRMIQDDKRVTQVSYILSEIWVNSLLAKKPHRGRWRFSNACVS